MNNKPMKKIYFKLIKAEKNTINLYLRAQNKLSLG